MSKFKKNVASNFTLLITKILLSFITSILLARALGPEGKGYTSYIFLVFTMISSYGHFGIIHATTYFQKKSKYTEEIVFGNNISYLLINWVLIAIIVISLRANNIVLADYSFYFIITGLLLVLFLYILNSVNDLYTGNERVSESNKHMRRSYMLYSAAIVVLYFLNYINIYSFFLLQTLTPLLNASVLLKHLNIKYRFLLNLKLLFEEFKYGFIVYLSTLFLFLNYRVDQILIKHMLGDAQLGLYSIGVTLAELLFLVPDSVKTALLAKLYNIDNQSNKKISTSRITKYTFYISLILSLVGIMATPLIPLVYGQDFKGSILVTCILFLGIIFASIGRVSYSYFITQGNPKIHLLISLAALIVNVIFNLLLIPVFGIYGAAIASAISYSIFGMVYILVFVKKEGFKFSDFFLFDSDDRRLLKEFILMIKNKLKNRKK